MDQRIINIYKSILNDGLVPHQYFYQRLKGRITGRPEFMLRKADGSNFLIVGAKDEMLIQLGGQTIKPGKPTFTFQSYIQKRPELYITTVKWITKYIHTIMISLIKKFRK